MVEEGADVELQLVALRLGVVELGAHHEALGLGVEGLDHGHLQQVVAAALGLLRERARALQALDAQLAQQLVLVQVRGVVQAVFLLGHERNPVERVVGEERVPFLVAAGVEQARFVDDEVDEVLAGDIDGGHYIVSVMRCTQLRYWLRMGSSLVPPVVISPPFSSDSS
ncbi:hypothetical protein FQZ97_670130 [compost metagenome]